MGKLKLEARHRVEQNKVRSYEIIEYAEQKLEENRQINSPSHLPIFDLTKMRISTKKGLSIGNKWSIWKRRNIGTC